MAYTTSILFAVLLLAAFTLTKDAPTETPSPNPLSLNDSSDINYCPPISSNDGKLNVVVLGANSPRIGGCAWLQPVRGIDNELIPMLELWLGRGDISGLRCGSPVTQMDRFVFECFDESSVEQNHSSNWIYIMLYNDQIEESGGEPDFQCALYWVIDYSLMLIQMIISKDRSCDGLSDKMKQPSYSYNLPPGKRQFSDGSMVLLFGSEHPVV